MENNWDLRDPWVLMINMWANGISEITIRRKLLSKGYFPLTKKKGRLRSRLGSIMFLGIVDQVKEMGYMVNPIYNGFYE